MVSDRSQRDAGQLSDAVRSLAVPVAEPLGVELLDVEVIPQSGRRVVRITADATELDAAGLDIDTIASLSRLVGKALEDEDLIAGAYTLEVTSPGADRPLRSARDFARNVGREVRLVPREESAQDAVGSAEVVGTVLAVTDEEVTLDIDGDQLVTPLEGIDHGQVVFPW